MSEFLGLLGELKDKGAELVVLVSGQKKLVRVGDIAGDLVTLLSQNNKERYDLHYSQVIICSVV